MKNICEIIFEFRPLVQGEMSLKDFSCLDLWQSFCMTEGNHFCNYAGGYYEEYFCEIALNLDSWFRRKCCLNIFLI